MLKPAFKAIISENKLKIKKITIFTQMYGTDYSIFIIVFFSPTIEKSQFEEYVDTAKPNVR